ncbi:hypothetical protein [Maribacter sp.]|uniref:hypothetical protein n=1 Tax=Maribacter sp. TaxID=1897614 RepID=UPI0025C42859|nr:hypothetical protein [Maribacter sp.]
MKPTILKLRQHILIALGFFFIAAFLGVILRSFHLLDIPVNYKFIVHTHSHIALLGWVYLALTTLLYKLYLSDENLDKRYSRIFWFTQVTLVGMLLSFPFQGYAVVSIIFSTLFLFASYWFTWFFIKNTPKKYKKTYAYTCFLIALSYLLLSSIGPWVLGIIMNTLGPTSIWYRIAIYFYLHFQYNGWMIMGLIGIFFFVMESYKIEIEKIRFLRFVWSFNIGIILTFLLSVLWISPPLYVNYIAGIGALLQIFAFGCLIFMYLKQVTNSSELFSSIQARMLSLLVVLMVLKMSLQLLSSFPYFAKLAATVLSFTIGYLHWTFLGVVTIGLFLFLDFFRLIRISKISFYVYVFGFLLTEILIFSRGFSIWQNIVMFENYEVVLVIVSVFIPLALLLIFKNNIKRAYS